MIRVPLLLASLALASGSAAAGPAVPPAPLPPPAGTVVNVATVSQLQNAVAAIASNTTIVIAPGTYNLSTTLYVNGSFTNVGIRGATGNRDDVVLVGKGMNAAGDGGVPFGIWVGGNVRGITIASLTIRDVYYHPIMLNAGAQSPLVHNVRLANAGQQLLKASPDGTGGGVDNGVVEYSVIGTICSETCVRRRASSPVRRF
jgi:pectate lyase